MNKKNYNNGFTMVELLTVTTIIVILIAAAIPGWRNFIQNNQATLIAAKLHASLNLARTTAIQSGSSVALCPITTITTTCQSFSSPYGTYCETSSTWDGWILLGNVTAFVVYGETHICNGNAGTLLKTYSDQPAGLVTASTTNSLIFDAAGYSTANVVFTILPPGCTGNNGRSVTVNRNGSVQIDTINCP
jgi:type IV fimbrial biogenesis protein FimT